jgi:hypothetical protein
MFKTCALAVAAALAIAAPAAAQNEAALKSFFEGRRVVIKIDMPGTSDGVDVRADASRPIDYQEYGNRLKSYGAAIRAGDTATVTLVKMKKDLIEFQLSGGGFGTFGDDTSSYVYMPTKDKSSREKELERLIKDEDDSYRRRRLQNELDDLRDRRERENRRIEAERVRAEEVKKEHIAEQRLRGGSRFNVRYSGSVPSGMRPEELMAALDQFVDFSPMGYLTPSQPPSGIGAGVPQGAPPPSMDVMPRKGMSREEAEDAFGRPASVSERREGSVIITTLVFMRGDQKITAEFVEDILVRYTLVSK